MLCLFTQTNRYLNKLAISINCLVSYLSNFLVNTSHKMDGISRIKGQVLLKAEL